MEKEVWSGTGSDSKRQEEDEEDWGGGDGGEDDERERVRRGKEKASTISSA